MEKKKFTLMIVDISNSDDVNVTKMTFIIKITHDDT